MRQRAVIVDIDGTLAVLHRSPYDYWLSYTDTVNSAVALVVNSLPGDVAILITSGREEYRHPNRRKRQQRPACNVRILTETWLRDNGIRYDRLIMRRSRDERPDDIVKEELYREHIHPFYDVEFVLDDRNRVVDMWRRIGLRCFQVQPGDF